MKLLIFLMCAIFIWMGLYAYTRFFIPDNVIENVEIIITKQYDIKNNIIIHGICCEDCATFIQHKSTSVCKFCKISDSQK